MAQVNRPGDMEYNGMGFRSGRSVTGSFSHTFTRPGVYHYIAEGYGHIGNSSLACVFLVIANTLLDLALVHSPWYRPLS